MSSKTKGLALWALLLLAVAAPSIAQTPPWRSIGPDQIGYGRVNVLAFDPQRPSRAFAGLAGGGIARSGDGGQTWSQMSDGLAGSRVSSVVVHPTLGTRVYAIAGGIVHRSVTDGFRWVPLPLERATGIALDPRDPSVVWAGTAAGLFRSGDSGDTWQPVQAGLPPALAVRSLAVDPQQPQRIYLGITAARGSGFWVSENGGQSWAQRSGTAPDRFFTDLRAARTVYVLQGGTLLRSRDAGRTLQIFFRPSREAAAGWLAQDPQAASTFFLAALKRSGRSAVVLRTTDDGRTWQPFSAGLARRLVPTALAVSSDGHVILGVQKEEVHFAAYRSETSAADWEPAARGLVNSGVYSAAFGSAGTLFGAVFTEGLARSLDGGANWTLALRDPELFGPIVPARSAPETVYVGGIFPHLLWKTKDNGDTWESLPYVLPVGGPNLILAADSLAVDPFDPETVYLGTIVSGNTPFELGGLYRSRNGGRTWQKIGLSLAGLTRDLDGDALQTFPGEPGKVLAIHGSTYIYLSHDYGETWTRVFERTEPFAYLYGLVVAPSDPKIVYALQEDGTVFRSDDGGLSFADLGRRIRTGFPPAIVVDPRDPDTLLFLGAYEHEEVAVRVTLGHGRELLQLPFANTMQCLVFDPSDPSRLLVGTESAGLMEYRFEEPTP